MSPTRLLNEDSHDRTLLAHVRPPDWKNPEPAPRYNLVVLGGGTAGLVSAAGAAGLGAKVALVERELLGGDCLNAGCVPSKALLRAARAAADARGASAFGVAGAEHARADFPAVMERLRRLRARLAPHDSAERFRGLGVDVFLGEGRFVSPDAVEVDGRRLSFARAIVTTGARAAPPPIPGAAEAGCLTNESVFALTRLPERLAVIGGGPIGCELAQAFARLGSKVTLLEAASRLLGREDADAARRVHAALERDGVDVRLSCSVPAVARRGDSRALSLGGGGELVVDEVLVGVGRAANVEGLGLEAAGIAYGPQGVAVDDRLRTANPRVYAAGDVCTPFKFTHAADAMARIAIQNALFLGRKRMSSLVIPRCTYTDPEIAHVGLTDEEARAQGLAVRTFEVALAQVDRAALDGEDDGLLKVHVREGTDRIVGATLVGRHAGETIGEVSLAMTAGLGLKALAATIHPYPTQAECLKKAADAYNRTRLTPLARALSGAWLRRWLVALLTLAGATAPAAAAEVSTRSSGPLYFENVPETPKAVVDRMLQYQNTRAARLAGFSPDADGLFIRTRFAETEQVHWVKVPGGARRQLTFFKERVAGAFPRPALNARELLLVMDEGGSEDYQLYRFRLGDAKPVLLTDGKSRNEYPRWSRRGDRVLYSSTRRNGRDFDFYVLDAETGESRRVAEVKGHWLTLDWSPDDSRALVLHYVSRNESSLHVLDLASGKIVPLFPVPRKEPVSYRNAVWSGAGSVLFTSDEAGEFVRLGRFEPATGKTRWLTAGLPWDVEDVAVSRDGEKAAFVVNEDGVSRLHLGPAGGPFDAVSDLPAGLISDLEFNRMGSAVGFVLNTPTTPGDVFTVDWARRNVLRWTESETGGLPGSAFVEPQLVRYETFDSTGAVRRRIPAFYYRPRGAGPFPAVVLIHGGPEGQSRPRFSPTIQYWVNELGLAVLVPNVRGSDGYGKTYLTLDNGRLREDSVQDIGRLLDWIGRRPELDATRVGVVGGSYGGYMVLATMARFGSRIKAGIDEVGISNFVTFLKDTRDYRRDLRRVEYGDERDPAMAGFLESISPTNLAHLIRSPLFVVQGKNDPRVPVTEAEQIVAAVRSAGRPVWYLLAADEGHGFNKKSNTDALGHAMSLFWERHLK